MPQLACTQGDECGGGTPVMVVVVVVVVVVLVVVMVGCTYCPEQIWRVRCSHDKWT